MQKFLNTQIVCKSFPPIGWLENKIWQVPAFLEFGSSKLELRLQGVGTFQKTFRRVEKYLVGQI
jgi:hypothetical protein